jgi:hypothetical protein
VIRSTEIAFAWAAGLFDGEGCITRSSTGRPRWALALTMTDEDVVRKFHRVVGCGRVNFRHTPADKARGSRPSWSWRTSAKADVQRVLQALLPYLGERRFARAREALEYLNKVK